MSVFLPKKKRTPAGQSRVPSARTARPVANGGPSLQSGPSRPPTAASSPAGGLPSGLSSDSPSEDLPPGYDPAKAIELPLFSFGDLNGTRYNIIRMNTAQDVDPRQIPSPILMNRKPRGGPTLPTVATDEDGNVIGKYVYDNEGKPVLDAEGQHVVERTVSRDHNLVGGATGQKKRRGKAIREVYHADIEAVKLRREEADPWVLESGRPKVDNANGVKSEAGPSGVKTENGRAGEDHNKIADRWVGTMLQPSNMATVLLLDSGAGGFNVVPLGRTYKFDPARPFTPLDPDAAQKAFEYQTKHKFQNRWEYRQGGPTTAADAVNRYSVLRQEARAQRLEQHMRMANGEERKPYIKAERFEDDAKREGRQMERGMEGGEDEELDYDINEDFQDDDDNNTFHRNEEEEEEQKRIEERLKKEFKLANATVGDRPQIEETEDSDEDLFGEKLNDQGKRLRRMMRKRGERPDDFYGTDSDTDTDSEAETVKSEKSVDKSKEEAEAIKSVPGSAERPSRPVSRPPSHRGSSPVPHRGTPPPSGNAQAALPGAGAAFVARRATGGAASPRRHRTGSPLGRAQSPETGSMRGSSPVSARGGSPAPGREGSPVTVPPAKPVKGGTTGKIARKTPTASPQPAGTPPGSVNASSPGPSNANKRKTSPGDDAARPKKTKRPGSSTPTPQPEDIEPFPGMITRQEVYKWFKSQNKEVVPMGEVIAAFKHRIGSTPKEKMGVNQKLFLGHVKGMTRQEENKMLRFQG